MLAVDLLAASLLYFLKESQMQFSLKVPVLRGLLYHVTTRGTRKELHSLGPYRPGLCLVSHSLGDQLNFIQQLVRTVTHAVSVDLIFKVSQSLFSVVSSGILPMPFLLQCLTALFS